MEEGVLQTPGHVVGPIEDGHVPPVVPRRLQLLEPGDDELRFRPHVLGVVVGGHGARGVHGPQVSLHPLAVLGDEGVGGGQDLGGAPVVLREDHGLGPRVLVGEIQNVVDVRPPPGVDGLVRVPHHEQVLMAAGKHVGELVLLAVDVLELVHHHVLKAPRPLLPDLLVLPQQGHRHVHQILEVQGVDLPLLVEVPVEHLPPAVLLPVDEIEKGPVGFAGQKGHVGQVPLHVVRQVRGLVEAHLLQGHAHVLEHGPKEGVLVLLVQHQEVLGPAQGVQVLLQNHEPQGVEGADVARVPVPHHVPDPLLHLVGGLVGEGHGQDVARAHAPRLHQIPVAPGEGPGLARAGPRHHPDAPLGGLHRPALGFVQSC